MFKKSHSIHRRGSNGRIRFAIKKKEIEDGGFDR
jgi:hypothetical protein